MRSNVTKTSIFVAPFISIIFLTACSTKDISSVPSYYKMSCKQLHDKEAFLQERKKTSFVIDIVGAVVDAATEDKETSKDDDYDQNLKHEIREIQRAEYAKGCIKTDEMK